MLIASRFPLFTVAKTVLRRSNHTLSNPAGVLDRFQNRARTHTVGQEIALPWSHRMTSNRNILFLIIGALVVVVAVLGYNVYQTKKQPEGLQINVGPNGLKIQNK
jgi:hypothetical protein